MIELLSVIIFISAAWALGCACLACLKLEKLKWLSVIVGYCVIIVIYTWGYFFFNRTVQFLQPAIYILAVLSLLGLWKKGKLAGQFHVLFALLCIFSFIALPIIIGGEQFYVFRGNHWDTFNYWGQILAFWAAPASTYTTGLPLLKYGLQLTTAPDSFFMSHGMGQIAAGTMFHGLGNPHLNVALYSCAIWAFTYTAYKAAWDIILRQLSNESGSLPRFFIREFPPIAITIGFWGQWTYDIGSWAHLTCYAPTVAFFFITYLYLASEANWKSRERLSLIILTSILTAGSLVIYPPATILYICILGLASLLWLVLTRRWLSLYSLLLLCSVFIITCIILLPIIQGIYGFFLRQLHEANANTYGWWTYFDSYWEGMERAPHDILLFFNLIPSLLGLYFITPISSVGSPLIQLWYGIIIIFGLLVIYCAALALTRNIFKDKGVLLFLQLVCVSSCAPLIFYLARDQLWTLGKALGYVSPFFLLLIFAPLGKKDAWRIASPIFRPFIVVASIVLVGHLAFGLARPISAFDPNGIGYDNTHYPSIQWRGIKADYEWSLDLSTVPRKSNVLMYIGNNDFYLYYVKQKLAYNKCPYWHLEPRKVYYGSLETFFPPLPVPEKTNFIIKQDVSSGKNKLLVVPVNGQNIYDLLWQEVVDIRYDNGREQIQIKDLQEYGWTCGPEVSLTVTAPPKILSAQGLQLTIPILHTFGQQKIIIQANGEKIGALTPENGKKLVLTIAKELFDDQGKATIVLSLPLVPEKRIAQKTNNPKSFGIYMEKIFFLPIIGETIVETKAYLE